MRTEQRIDELLMRRNALDTKFSERLDRVLKTKMVIVIFLVLLLIAQVHHTVHVYDIATHGETPWYAWCYAIGIEGAILIFVVNGWRYQSILFSIATVFTNILYGKYGSDQIPMDVNLTISALLGGAITGFSHLYYTKMMLIQSIIEEVEDGNIDDQQQSVPDRPPVAQCQRPNCHKEFYEHGQINGHITSHIRTDPPHWWNGYEWAGKADEDLVKWYDNNKKARDVVRKEKQRIKEANGSLSSPITNNHWDELISDMYNNHLEATKNSIQFIEEHESKASH